MKEQIPRIRLSKQEYLDILRGRGNLTAYNEANQSTATKIPKFLLLDVETMPIKVLTFHLSKQVIHHDRIIEDDCIICWSAKWLNGESFGDCLTPEEARVRDDKRIMQGIWKALNDCDVAVGHNLRRFDLRKIQARFWVHGMTPPNSFQVVDTLKESQKIMGTLSHRLDYLGRLLFNKGKLHTEFSLWERCLVGDVEALDYMFKYNKEDVNLLEQVFVSLRAYIRPFPNFAILSESVTPCCVYCGCTELADAGIYTTQANRYSTYRCAKCGGVMRGRKADTTLQERENLLLSIAR